MKKNLFYLLYVMIFSLTVAACEKENPTPIPAQTQEPMPTTQEYNLEEGKIDDSASPPPAEPVEDIKKNVPDVHGPNPAPEKTQSTES